MTVEPFKRKTCIFETNLSLSILNHGTGNGFVKMSAIFFAVGTYLICNRPCFNTSLQNFNLLSICVILDFEDSFRIEYIAGLGSSENLLLCLRVNVWEEKTAKNNEVLQFLAGNFKLCRHGQVTKFD